MGRRQATEEIKTSIYTLVQAFGATGPRALPVGCSSWVRPWDELIDCSPPLGQLRPSPW